MSQLDRLESKLDQLLSLLGEQPKRQVIDFPTPSSYQLRCKQALLDEAERKERKQLRQ